MKILKTTITDAAIDTAVAAAVAAAFAHDDDDKVWCHIMHFEVCN